jgi:hypothetical protein
MTARPLRRLRSDVSRCWAPADLLKRPAGRLLLAARTAARESQLAPLPSRPDHVEPAQSASDRLAAALGAEPAAMLVAALSANPRGSTAGGRDRAKRAAGCPEPAPRPPTGKEKPTTSTYDVPNRQERASRTAGSRPLEREKKSRPPHGGSPP